MERTEKRILVAVAAIVLAVVCAVLVIRFPNIKAANEAKQSYTGFDKNALAGTPQITDKKSDYGSLELPISNGKCILSMDAVPLLEQNKLHLFLAADEDNSVYIRVILYNEEKQEVGRSGLLKAGEYVDSVEVADTVTSGSNLKVKILTFEPDTYYSGGSASAAVNVR